MLRFVINDFIQFIQKRKKGRGKNYGRFLKMMIDDLQTPLYKTNHKYRSYFPLTYYVNNNQAKIFCH